MSPVLATCRSRHVACRRLQIEHIGRPVEGDRGLVDFYMSPKPATCRSRHVDNVDEAIIYSFLIHTSYILSLTLADTSISIFPLEIVPCEMSMHSSPFHLEDLNLVRTIIGTNGIHCLGGPF
jgi:hypothetical protein